MTPTPYVSSLNSTIKAIAQEYFDYLGLHFGDVKGYAISPEDGVDADLRRIRETNNVSGTPENKEQLPYLVMSVSGVSGTTNHPDLEKYKLSKQQSKVPVSINWAGGIATVNAPGHGMPNGGIVDGTGFSPTAYNASFTITKVDDNTFTFPLASNPGAVTMMGKFTLSKQSGGMLKTLFRLVDLDLKARVYVTNYAQALVLLEYILCTNLRAFQYTVINPHLSDSIIGRVSVGEPAVSKVTDLENNGNMYKVEVELKSNAVLTIPVSEQKLILTPIADFLYQEPVYGLERATLSNGNPVITPL